MRYETKADLMRHLYLITRHFTAASFSLRPSRETDGARVIVSAGLAAIMDALLRRPLSFAGTDGDGSQLSMHYSGEAEGPAKAFCLDPGAYREVSESLTLVAPEYASLRALTLDYFDSIRRVTSDDHVIFQFDQTMECTEGDRRFIEQVGLCLGVDAARREAGLLITGERPELSELFLELSWFRDVVFLWKMLLLPNGAGPAIKNWRATDSILNWRWKKDRYSIFGFDTELSAVNHAEPEAGPGIAGVFGGLKGLFNRVQVGVKGLFGSTKAERFLIQASPSALTGSNVQTEDDILFLDHLPDFNGTLRPTDSELLLTYLTAPYIRVPLLLGFFTDRDRISLLREPQLQAVLDAALFEPGTWQSQAEASRGPPATVPAPDRAHLGTPVGLLFNEFLRSPKFALAAVQLMLEVAVDKDTGRPGAANEGLILYIVRLAVRVESFLHFLVQHSKNDGYLERAGANWEAKVRGLPVKGDSRCADLEKMHMELRDLLEGRVFRMLLEWARLAMRRP